MSYKIVKRGKVSPSFFLKMNTDYRVWIFEDSEDASLCAKIIRISTNESKVINLSNYSEEKILIELSNFHVPIKESLNLYNTIVEKYNECLNDLILELKNKKKNKIRKIPSDILTRIKILKIDNKNWLLKQQSVYVCDSIQYQNFETKINKITKELETFNNIIP